VTDDDLPESIAANVATWTRTNENFTDAQAERAWQPQDLTWGVFGVREDAIGSPLGEGGSRIRSGRPLTRGTGELAPEHRRLGSSGAI
jgi:hypothetical protein